MNEKIKVLDMFKEGKIDYDQTMKLLEAIEKPAAEGKPQDKPASAASKATSAEKSEESFAEDDLVLLIQNLPENSYVCKIIKDCLKRGIKASSIMKIMVHLRRNFN